MIYPATGQCASGENFGCAFTLWNLPFERIYKVDNFFAYLIAFEMVNIMPAIIRNQSCSHDFCKLLLILHPISFLVLTIGRKQQSWALNIPILPYDSCVVQNFFCFVYTARIECISFLQEPVLFEFIFRQRKITYGR